ncbi:MAG: fatty acid desaturase [Pseudomonadota bacterium]
MDGFAVARPGGSPEHNPHTVSAREWAARLVPYRNPNLRRALFDLSVTLFPFVGLIAVGIWLMSISYWLAPLIWVPAALFLVRVFIIQHDCGHGSYFSSKRLNDAMGMALSVLTMTPYHVWKQAHKHHHAGAGHLDKRGVGDVHTMTLAEYRSAGYWQRLGYRLFRNPLTLFVVGPAFVFILQNRIPIEFLGHRGYWASAMATNAGIAILAALTIWTVGLTPILLVVLPSTILASTIGVWLFYVQHQFEETHWSGQGEWQVHHAALHGSSYYDLPEPLDWLTGYIGVHHVHHLNSRIPSYRLPEVLRDHPELTKINRLTIGASLKSLKLHLWDEDERKLISFCEARKVIA